jgi:hypothetical protein
MYLRDAASPGNFPIKGRPCLACAVPMSVVYGPGPSDGGMAGWTRQRVDVCTACDNLWLDPNELTDLDSADEY